MIRNLRLAALSLGFLLAAPAAHAACGVETPRDDLTYEDAQAIYDCLKDDMLAGYQKGSKRWIPADFVKDYRGWTAASTLPADPGVHGERFLLTFVNAVGAEAYLKYADDGSAMPAGTVIAKESFAINKKSQGKAGPLFLMQKVEAGTSPQTNDWYYMAVAPNGTPMAVNVVKACHECHSAFEDQDSLGYPVEEVRVGAN